MPISPTAIFANLLAPPKSVADYDQQAQGLQQNALALSTARIQNQNALRDQQEAGDYRDAARNFGADPTANYNALLQRGLPTQAAAYQKSALEGLKTQSDIGLNTAHAGNFSSETSKRDFETRVAKSDQAIKDIAAFKTPQEASASLDAHFQAGDIDPQKYQALKQQIPTDPAQFPQWQVGMLNGILSAKDKLYMDAENQRAANANAVSLTNNEASNKTHLQAAGIAASTSRANNAANIAKDYNVAGLNPDGTYKGIGSDGQVDLSKVAPEDMAAAQRYRTDGTLPPNMGRGAQGAAESRKLRAVAAALDDQAGQSPEDARIRQLAAKGDIGAINQMRKREVAVGANVKNFDFNADQALQLSNKVDRTGVPVVNAWINAGRRSVTGNPDLTAFDIAVKTTVNEFAQIVSGTTAGATTEGEKKKAEALLNSQQTPEQIIAAINQMKIESRNRMASFKAQRAEMMPTNGASRTGGVGAGNDDIHAQADAILRGNK